MKLRAKVLIVVPILIVLVFGASYIFLLINGKDLVAAKLQEASRRPVTIGHFQVNPLLNIVIKDLEIKGLAKVKVLSISPSIASFFFGALALNKLEMRQPEITLERERPTTGTPSPLAAAVQAATASLGAKIPPAIPQHPTAITFSLRPERMIIKHLNITGGRINFLDHAVGADGISITLKDINFNLTNLYLLPVSAIANFELKAKIPWREGAAEGAIAAEGWLNLHKKDLRATVKIEGIDGVYLYPYYSAWVDLDKARIEKATLNLSSDLSALNNDLTAKCRLELSDIVRKPRPADEPSEKAERIANAVIDIFRAMNQGKIVLDFTIRTRMDLPRFGMGEAKDAFDNVIAEGAKSKKIHVEDILMLPAKVAEGGIRGATDLSKAMIDGSFAVANEFKEALKASFRREPRYEKEE